MTHEEDGDCFLRRHHHFSTPSWKLPAASEAQNAWRSALRSNGRAGLLECVHEWLTFLMKERRLGDSEQKRNKNLSPSQNPWYAGWQDSCLLRGRPSLKPPNFQTHKSCPGSYRFLPFLCRRNDEKVKKRKGERENFIRYQNFNI